MSATISLYLRSELLRRFFLAGEPQDCYLALCSVVPQANATGDQLLEPVAGGYARAVYETGTDRWAPSGYGEVYNTRRLVFDEAVSDWGLIAGWALVDSPNSGLTLAVGSVLTPTFVVAGVTPVAEVGSITAGLYD